MDLILVRYAEMGLKSQAVRKRFERILVDNMMSNLAEAGLEALITTEQGRIFVEPQDIDRAIKVLKRVMGVASLSPVLRCRSDMETMKRVAGLKCDNSVPAGATETFAEFGRRVA